MQYVDARHRIDGITMERKTAGVGEEPRSVHFRRANRDHRGRSIQCDHAEAVGNERAGVVSGPRAKLQDRPRAQRVKTAQNRIGDRGLDPPRTIAAAGELSIIDRFE